jgi:LmbE family N-acetylglucosaminyl deacetylase
MENFKKVLFIGAHFDDVDLACFGTMAKLIANGIEVYKLTLTDNVTVYEGLVVDYDLSRIQSQKICNLIGVKQLDFDVFPCSQLGNSQKEMQAIEAVINNIKPDAVFTHHYYDVNMDHIAASNLVTTAARHVKSLLYYKSNMYFNTSFKHNLFFDISDYIELKKQALNIYSSEHDRKDRLFNHAITRDILCADNFNVTAVESFEILRLYA